MTEQEYFAALARNLYWGYKKETTGEPGKWADLSEDERKVWRSLARRAAKKIAELDALIQTQMPA